MSKKAIDDCMRSSVEQYLKDLRGAEPGALHELFLGAAERPLLEVVLRHAEGYAWCREASTPRRWVFRRDFNPGGAVTQTRAAATESGS